MLIVRRETVGELALRVVSRAGGYYLVAIHPASANSAGIMWLARNFDQAMRRVDLRLEYLRSAA